MIAVYPDIIDYINCLRFIVVFWRESQMQYYAIVKIIPYSYEIRPVFIVQQVPIQATPILVNFSVCSLNSLEKRQPKMLGLSNAEHRVSRYHLETSDVIHLPSRFQ
jgi:hypothetical protein